MRTITTTPPELDDSILCEKGIVTDTYTIKIVTPMFGGGTRPGQVDEDMPIRASSIRGHLRYWWRMLYGTKNDPSKTFEDESKLWGCAASDNEQKDTPASNPAAVLTVVVGKISLDGNVLPREKLNKYSLNYLAANDKFKYKHDGKEKEKDGTFGFDKYGPEAYVLFSPKENNNKLLKYGYEFDLLVSYFSDIDERKKEQISNSIKLWCLLGGIGSRTRRGCGSLNLEKVNNQKVDNIDMVDYAKLMQDFAIYTKEANNALTAWQNAVLPYKRFRQDRNKGTSIKSKKPGGKDIILPGRSKWPEPDSLRYLTNCALDEDANSSCANTESAFHKHTIPVVDKSLIPSFPRAVMGLPINIRFKDGLDEKVDENVVSTKDPAPSVIKAIYNDKKRERMASPIITKPIKLGSKWFSAIVFAPFKHVFDMGILVSGKKINNGALADFEESTVTALPKEYLKLSALLQKPNAIEAFKKYILQHSNHRFSRLILNDTEDTPNG